MKMDDVFGHEKLTMTSAGSLIADLEEALAQDQNARGTEMLSRVTDLFFSGNGHYSADQMHLFDEVIGKLVCAIEPVARAKLAARLAREPNAPAGVIRMLAFDDNIEVARPVLRNSECLGEADLVANASSKGPRHLAAIAERQNLSEAVTDVLVTRGDQEIAYTVSENPSARISYAGFRTLLRRSIDDDKLAILLGTRGDLPRQHFLRLIEHASTAVRARLLAENAGEDSAIAGVIEEISTDLQTDAKEMAADHDDARRLVEGLHRAGKLDEAQVRRFALERRHAETAFALAVLSAVEPDIVERALLAATGSDILVVLAKLAGFSWDTVRTILSLKARGHDAQNLTQAKASFERLQVGTARHVLGFYRTRLMAGG